MVSYNAESDLLQGEDINVGLTGTVPADLGTSLELAKGRFCTRLQKPCESGSFVVGRMPYYKVDDMWQVQLACHSPSPVFRETFKTNCSLLKLHFPSPLGNLLQPLLIDDHVGLSCSLRLS